MNPPKRFCAYVTACPLKKDPIPAASQRFRRRNEYLVRCTIVQKSLAFWWNNYIFTRLKAFFYSQKINSWDSPYEGPEISIPMKEWFLSTKKSSGHLTFWTKPRNKSTITPNDIENSCRSNFLVLEDIEDSKLSYLMRIEQIRKNITHLLSWVRSCSIIPNFTL